MTRFHFVLASQYGNLIGIANLRRKLFCHCIWVNTQIDHKIDNNCVSGREYNGQFIEYTEKRKNFEHISHMGFVYKI